MTCQGKVGRCDRSPQRLKYLVSGDRRMLLLPADCRRMTLMIPIYQMCTGGNGKLSERCVYACENEGRLLDSINGFHTSLRYETPYCEHMSVLELDALWRLFLESTRFKIHTGCGDRPFMLYIIFCNSLNFNTKCL